MISLKTGSDINSLNLLKASNQFLEILWLCVSVYQTDFDSVIFDSHTKSDSFTVVLVEPTYRGGVEEGFAMMSPGDSAIFKVSADSVFEKTFHSTLPQYLKPGSSLTFRVALDNIISKQLKDSLESTRDVEMRVKEFETYRQISTTE